MSDQNDTLQFTLLPELITDCVCDIYVSGIQFVGNPTNPNVLITVSYNSTFNIKGYQLDFDIPWLDKIEILQPGVEGSPNDVDVTQKRKYIDGTWNCAVDSSLSQQIIAWDVSAQGDVAQAIPDTRLGASSEYFGPRVLCRILGTPISGFMAGRNGILPSIKEVSERLIKAIAVTCDLAKGIPEASWRPAVNSVDLANLISNNIFDAAANGYDASKDAKLAESEGLSGVIHIADVVACQEVVDQELTATNTVYTNYHLVPLVICNLRANTRPPQYESDCIQTDLRCEGNEMVLDVFALGSVPDTVSQTTQQMNQLDVVSAPITTSYPIMNTCEIGGYHVMLKLLNFPTGCDLDTVTVGIGGGAAQDVGLVERVQAYESIHGDKFVEFWAFPAWGNELPTIAPQPNSVKLTSIRIGCEPTAAECENMVSWNSSASIENVNTVEGADKIFAVPLVGYNSYGKTGSRIWSGNDAEFISHGPDWTGDRTESGSVEEQDYDYLVLEMLDGGFNATHDLALDSNGDGESDVGDVISLIKWMATYGHKEQGVWSASTLATQILLASSQAGTAAVNGIWQTRGRNITPPLCCGLSSDPGRDPDDDGGEIFRTRCGCQLELRGCTKNSSGKFDLSFTLKYSQGINKNLSGFEFWAKVPNNLSIGTVTVDLGGDANAAGWKNAGNVYFDTSYNAQILKVAGSGVWEGVEGSSYPVIHSGSGPILVNFTLTDVDLTAAYSITECIQESFLSETHLILWTNDTLRTAPATWTGDFTSDGVVNNVDWAGVMIGVLTDRNDNTTPTHETHLRTIPAVPTPSTQDIITISNYIFSGNPAAGLTSGVKTPDRSNPPTVVPTIICRDECRVVWEPPEYEVDEDCVLEFDPSRVICMPDRTNVGVDTQAGVVAQTDEGFHRGPVNSDTLDFTLVELLHPKVSCHPAPGDIVVEVKYRSSCNLAGVQFEIDRSALPKDCRKIKCVVSPPGSPADIQNWVWKWDAKGISDVVFGCIQPCCPSETPPTTADFNAAATVNNTLGFTLIEWLLPKEDACEESDQIPSTLVGDQLCWVILEGAGCELPKCPEPERFGINKDKGVTFDRTGGLLSSEWTGNIGVPIDPPSGNLPLNQFDFNVLAKSIIQNAYTPIFDANGDTQLDVLDAVFLAQAIRLCLLPGPYNWLGIDELYESVDGDIPVNVVVGGGTHAITTHVSTPPIAKKPQLAMPAYCCPDEEQSDCEADIKIKALRCDEEKGVVVALIGYKSNGNSVAGFQFDLSYNFKASEVIFTPVDVTGSHPYSVTHTTHKDVYNSAYVTRFIGTQYIKEGSPFYSYILPPSNNVAEDLADRRHGVSFGLVEFRGVDIGNCECPTTEFFIRPSRRHIEALSIRGTIPTLIPYTGKFHEREDGYFWTGAKPSKDSQRIHKQHSGMGLCQPRLVTNDLRRPIPWFPEAQSSPFDVADYRWNGDADDDADRDMADVVALIQEALYNGVLPGENGIGKYDYQLDANWDGKLDIADVVALHNYVGGGIALYRREKLNIVPQYICNKSDFNSCSRPNCCDADPCGQSPFENVRPDGLHLHFGPPLHVPDWSVFWTGENQDAWGELLDTVDVAASDAPFTLVDIRLCADGSDTNFVHGAKIELDLPEGYSIKKVVPGSGFKHSVLQADGRSIHISGGPEGEGQFYPETAITHDGGPLTMARVMITPMLEETLCFDCGKIKTIITDPCCPDATDFDITASYKLGDHVWGVKWFVTETGTPVDQVNGINYEADSTGAPVLDSDGNIQWYLQSVVSTSSVGLTVSEMFQSIKIPLTLVKQEDCYELVNNPNHPQTISGDYLFKSGSIPGYLPSRIWAKVECDDPITITEWTGGTSITTSPRPFQHPRLRKRVYECYEKEKADIEADPTRLRTLVSPGIYGAMRTLAQYYTNVTTDIADTIQYNQLETTGSALVSGGGGFRTQGSLGVVATPAKLFEGNLSFGGPIDLLRKQTRQRVNILTFGPCHPCVSCCSPVATTQTEYYNYNNGQYFSNNDIDLYLEVVDSNTIEIKYCTNNRISFFQFGIKVNEGFDLLAIDSEYGVATNLDYELTLSKYISREDKKDVYVVTGQISRDDCESSDPSLGPINYIDCTADKHSTLVRLHLRTDQADGIIWEPETILKNQQQLVTETPVKLFYAFDATPEQGYFILNEHATGVIHFTQLGNFTYNHDTGTMCWVTPLQQNEERYDLLGFPINDSGVVSTILGTINLGPYPDNVTIALDGVISVDGVPAFQIAAAHFDDEALLVSTSLYVGLYTIGTATETIGVAQSGYFGSVAGRIVTRRVLVEGEPTKKYNTLRCPPLYPHDKCFAEAITNILCITKPLKFLTPSKEIQTGEFDPSTGLIEDCCDGAIPWDAGATYQLGDKVYVDEEGCDCYEYLCEPHEDECCPEGTPQWSLATQEVGGYSYGDWVWKDGVCYKFDCSQDSGMQDLDPGCDNEPTLTYVLQSCIGDRIEILVSYVTTEDMSGFQIGMELGSNTEALGFGAIQGVALEVIKDSDGFPVGWTPIARNNTIIVKGADCDASTAGFQFEDGWGVCGGPAIEPWMDGHYSVLNQGQGNERKIINVVGFGGSLTGTASSPTTNHCPGFWKAGSYPLCKITISSTNVDCVALAGYIGKEIFGSNVPSGYPTLGFPFERLVDCDLFETTTNPATGDIVAPNNGTPEYEDVEQAVKDLILSPGNVGNIADYNMGYMQPHFNFDCSTASFPNSCGEHAGVEMLVGASRYITAKDLSHSVNFPNEGTQAFSASSRYYPDWIFNTAICCWRECEGVEEPPTTTIVEDPCCCDPDLTATDALWMCDKTYQIGDCVATLKAHLNQGWAVIPTPTPIWLRTNYDAANPASMAQIATYYNASSIIAVATLANVLAAYPSPQYTPPGVPPLNDFLAFTLVELLVLAFPLAGPGGYIHPRCWKAITENTCKEPGEYKDVHWQLVEECPCPCNLAADWSSATSYDTYSIVKGCGDDCYMWIGSSPTPSFAASVEGFGMTNGVVWQVEQWCEFMAGLQAALGTSYPINLANFTLIELLVILQIPVPGFHRDWWKLNCCACTVSDFWSPSTAYEVDDHMVWGDLDNISKTISFSCWRAKTAHTTTASVPTTATLTADANWEQVDCCFEEWAKDYDPAVNYPTRTERWENIVKYGGKYWFPMKISGPTATDNSVVVGTQTPVAGSTYWYELDGCTQAEIDTLNFTLIESMLGCTDPTACNYNAQLHAAVGSALDAYHPIICTYPQPNRDCDGNPLIQQTAFIPTVELPPLTIFATHENPCLNPEPGIGEDWQTYWKHCPACIEDCVTDVAIDWQNVECIEPGCEEPEDPSCDPSCTPVLVDDCCEDAEEWSEDVTYSYGDVAWYDTEEDCYKFIGTGPVSNEDCCWSGTPAWDYSLAKAALRNECAGTGGQVFDYGDFVTYGGKCWKFICDDYDPCLPLSGVQADGDWVTTPGAVGQYDTVACETPWFCYEVVNACLEEEEEDDTIQINVKYHSEENIHGFQTNITLPYPAACLASTGSPTVSFIDHDTINGGTTGQQVQAAITVDSVNELLHIRLLGFSLTGNPMTFSASPGQGNGCGDGQGTLKTAFSLKVTYPRATGTNICQCLKDEGEWVAPFAGSLLGVMPSAAVPYERIIGRPDQTNNTTGTHGGLGDLNGTGTLDILDIYAAVGYLLNPTVAYTYHGWGALPHGPPGSTTADYSDRQVSNGVENIIAMINVALGYPLGAGTGSTRFETYGKFLHETSQCCWVECIETATDPCGVRGGGIPNISPQCWERCENITVTEDCVPVPCNPCCPNALTYDPSTSYTAGDVVLYEDECWTAKQDGHLNPPKEYGTTECCPDALDYSSYPAGHTFAVGDRVIYCAIYAQDKVCVCFEAISAGVLGDPDAKPCCEGAVEWINGRLYSVGDQVWYNNQCWEALGPPTVSFSGLAPSAAAEAECYWKLADCPPPKWKKVDCDEWDKVPCDPSCDPSGNGQITIPIWYISSCDNISGFSLKLTGVPSSFTAADAVLHGGAAAAAGFIQKIYKDVYGDFWIVGVLTDLEKLLHVTGEGGKLLTNITFYGGTNFECDDWAMLEACGARFVSNTILTPPQPTWTGDTDSSGYITTEDVTGVMDIIPASWNNYQYEDPWSEFIDAEYDGVIRVEDAVTVMNHTLINADDFGIVRPGVHGFIGAGNTFYGVGAQFNVPTNVNLGTHMVTDFGRPNVIKRDPVSRNIVPQVCCEEEIFTDCLCPCDEPIEEPCINNIRLGIQPALMTTKAKLQMAAPVLAAQLSHNFKDNKLISGYWLTVYYSTSCCLDGYWIEFDGIKNIPGNELNIYPMMAAEPVKRKWFQYTGHGPDAHLWGGFLDLVPTNVVFGWAKAPYIRSDGALSLFATGAPVQGTQLMTHYNPVFFSEPTCLPATDIGEEKILVRCYVDKSALEHDELGQPVVPTIKNFRLITNEVKNVPAEGWTGDIIGIDSTGIVGPDGKVGLLDEFVGAVLGSVMGATGTLVPTLDAEGDGGYLDIVDIVTIWNHYISILPAAWVDDGALGLINGMPVPTPMPEIVPTDCCPWRCEEEVPGSFKLSTRDCVTNPELFGCDGKEPGAIYLDWTPSENASGYRVYRADNILVPIHVSFDPSVTRWVDLNPPGDWSEDPVQIHFGNMTVNIKKDGCCNEERAEVKYLVVAFNDCGEVPSNVATGELCCCNTGPRAKDLRFSICMNEKLRGVFVAFDPDVPPMSTTCDPAIEICDALYYEILQVSGGTVSPPPGHIQPGPFGQFIFVPDPDFVGVAYIEYKVWDSSGCWDCGLVTIYVLPESPQIVRIDTGDCIKYLSHWGEVTLAWTPVLDAEKYNIYRRKEGEDAWTLIAIISPVGGLPPATHYTDTNFAAGDLPDAECQDGVVYEYAVSVVKTAYVTRNALTSMCDDDDVDGTGNNSECCREFLLKSPITKQKIARYRAMAVKNKWEEFCHAPRILLLKFGFNWHEIGFRDCCCGKSEYSFKHLSDSEKKALVNASNMSFAEIQEIYLKGYNECCDENSIENKPGHDGPVKISIESCFDPAIPKPNRCCALPARIKIPCCPGEPQRDCCLDGLQSGRVHYEQLFFDLTENGVNWLTVGSQYLYDKGVSEVWIGLRDCCNKNGYHPVGDRALYDLGYGRCGCRPDPTVDEDCCTYTRLNVEPYRTAIPEYEAVGGNDFWMDSRNDLYNFFDSASSVFDDDYERIWMIIGFRDCCARDHFGNALHLHEGCPADTFPGVHADNINAYNVGLRECDCPPCEDEPEDTGDCCDDQWALIEQHFPTFREEVEAAVPHGSGVPPDRLELVEFVDRWFGEHGGFPSDPAVHGDLAHWLVSGWAYLGWIHCCYHIGWFPPVNMEAEHPEHEPEYIDYYTAYDICCEPGTLDPNDDCCDPVWAALDIEHPTFRSTVNAAVDTGDPQTIVDACDAFFQPIGGYPGDPLTASYDAASLLTWFASGWSYVGWLHCCGDAGFQPPDFPADAGDYISGYDVCCDPVFEPPPFECTDLTVVPTACGDAGHPNLTITWTPIPGAHSYWLTVIGSDHVNAYYNNFPFNYPVEVSNIDPCYCGTDDNGNPIVPETITVTLFGINALDEESTLCSVSLELPCCPIPMVCPPAEDRTWYTDKNEIVIDQVPPVVWTTGNHPNCDASDIVYSLVPKGDDECCPDLTVPPDGTKDCGPFNGTVYKKSTYGTTNVVGIDTNGEFVYVPHPHWTSQYDPITGDPLPAPLGGPDSFVYKATDCCDVVVCCEIIVHVTVDVCDEDDYVICDATIAYLSSQFIKGPLNPDQLPFSLNRRGGQTLRQTKRAYIVTKGMNPLLDPDWS